jgi:spore coat protein U-like protein
MYKAGTISGLVATLVLTLSVSQAGQQSDTMQVAIAVEAACTITANDLDFGTVRDTTFETEFSSSVIVRCPAGVPWEIGLNGGLNPLQLGTRQMAHSSGALIRYDLYANTDLLFVTRWVDRFESTDPSLYTTVTGDGAGADQAFEVGGIATGDGSSLPAGNYSDTVTATVYF